MCIRDRGNVVALAKGVERTVTQVVAAFRKLLRETVEVHIRPDQRGWFDDAGARARLMHLGFCSK
eukprot:14171285-Alexandrium_andersonii.AAC.1